MGSMVYHAQGSILVPVRREDIPNPLTEISVGNYQVVLQEEPKQPPRFILKIVDDFTIPKTLYGNTQALATRVIKTFRSRSSSTGVLLAGLKGSGKTMLAKKIAADLKIPVLIVSDPFSGTLFNEFLQSIQQEVIVLFDEFEKVYSNFGNGRMAAEPVDDGEHHNPSQERLLNLLDGIYNSKKLFIFAVNRPHLLDDNLINRPGRIFYRIDFSGLDEKFIREYCQANLNNHQWIDSVVHISSFMEKEFNFDMLQAIVEESNRFDEDPKDSAKFLNIKPQFSRNTYAVSLEINGKKIDPKLVQKDHGGTIDINPSADFNVEYYENEKKAKEFDETNCRVSSDNCKSFSSNRIVYEGVWNGKNYRVVLTRKIVPEATPFSF